MLYVTSFSSAIRRKIARRFQSFSSAETNRISGKNAINHCFFSKTDVQIHHVCESKAYFEICPPGKSFVYLVDPIYY